MRIQVRVCVVVFLCSVLLLTLGGVANGAPAGKKDGKGKAPASSQGSTPIPHSSQNTSQPGFVAPCSSHGMPPSSQEEIAEWQDICYRAVALLKDSRAAELPETSSRMQEITPNMRSIRRPRDIPDRVNRAEMERNRDTCFALCNDIVQKAQECAALNRDCWQMLGEIRAKMGEDEQQRADSQHIDLTSSESENGG